MTDEAFVPQRDPFLKDETDDHLVRQVVILTESIQATENRLAEIEREITLRMKEREAIAMDVPDFEVALKLKGSRQYDPHMVVAGVGELLSPERLKKLVKPEHEETKVVPARVDGNEANRVRKLGKVYAEALDEALLPRPLVLTITPKEAKS